MNVIPQNKSTPVPTIFAQQILKKDLSKSSPLDLDRKIKNC